MNILIIARTCPFPANDGEKLRVFNILKNLKEHQITLVCRTRKKEEEQGLKELKKYCHEVRGVYIPRPTSFIHRVGWILPFIFSKYPLSLATVYFSKIMETLSELCTNNRYDIVQIEHSSLSIYLDYLSFSEEPKKIVTLHNIDFIRNARVIKYLSFGIRKIYEVLNQRHYKDWEMSALTKFDRIITTSQHDKEILLEEEPQLNIDVLSCGVDTEAFRPDPRSKLMNHSLIFVASMDSNPNHDAAIFFLEKIFPLVKKLFPNVKIYIVGRCPKPELNEYDNGMDIIVTGTVENVLEYYGNASIAVVPLRSGGGVRLKILEAMASGIPVISTTVGCEGLNVEHNKNLLIADTPVAFCNNIVRLFGDETTYQALSEAGRRLVEAEYDWKQIAEVQNQIYMSVNNNGQEEKGAMGASCNAS